MNLYEDEVARLYEIVDRAGNGAISYAEFKAFWLKVTELLPEVCACQRSISRSPKWCKLLNMTTGKMVYMNKWTGLEAEAAASPPKEYLELKPHAQQFHKAAASGNAEAQHALAQCYFGVHGANGVRRNLELALAWELKAGRAGHPSAALQVAGCFLSVSPLFTSSTPNQYSSQGSLHSSIQIMLTTVRFPHDVITHQRHGWGVAPNLMKSASWYRRSARLGSRPAQTALREPRVANALAWLEASEQAEIAGNDDQGRGPFTNQELNEKAANHEAGLGAVTDREVQERSDNVRDGWGEGTCTELLYCMNLATKGELSVIRDICLGKGFLYKALMTARTVLHEGVGETKGEQETSPLGKMNPNLKKKSGKKPVQRKLPPIAKKQTKLKKGFQERYEYSKHANVREKTAIQKWGVDPDFCVDGRKGVVTVAEVAKRFGHRSFVKFFLNERAKFVSKEQGKVKAAKKVVQRRIKHLSDTPRRWLSE